MNVPSRKMGDFHAVEAHESQSITEGWLMKWVGPILGYKKRWFILNGDLLAYYGNKDEINDACIESIYVPYADIRKVDYCTFTVSIGSSQKFLIRADSMRERNQWMRTLKVIKSRATGVSDYNIEEEEVDPETMKVNNRPMNFLRNLGMMANAFTFRNLLKPKKWQNEGLQQITIAQICPPKSNLGVEVKTN